MNCSARKDDVLAIEAVAGVFIGSASVTYLWWQFHSIPFHSIDTSDITYAGLCEHMLEPMSWDDDEGIFMLLSLANCKFKNLNLSEYLTCLSHGKEFPPRGRSSMTACHQLAGSRCKSNRQLECPVSMLPICQCKHPSKPRHVCFQDERRDPNKN